ncbi:GNAT family N-acetyltransferase [Amycolatopsis minnesotensis]|uniref:N-acetyltransferase domain-containing protein n=1 Tax=Amycolatopsis minnesotensis TaxID=337894 RepID=A0ABP5DML1_9PSEU
MVISGATGEFGRVDEYVRPRWGDRRWPRCPCGHELAIGGVTGSWSHALGLPTMVCLACQTAGTGRGSWVEIDVTRQYTPETAPGSGLALVRHRPASPAGAGRVELVLATTVVGHVELALCRIERRANLRALEVEPAHRRRGYGTVLAAAAKTLAPDYDWSVPAFVEDPVARSFWAAAGVPGPAPLAPCSHIRDALGLPSEAWTGT